MAISASYLELIYSGNMLASSRHEPHTRRDVIILRSYYVVLRGPDETVKLTCELMRIVYPLFAEYNILTVDITPYVAVNLGSLRGLDINFADI
jgi:hypothetical protein